MYTNIDPVALKEKLMEIAQQECCCDDEEFIPNDYAAGNPDDSYYNGVDDGQTLLARKILKEFWGETHDSKTCQPR